MSFKHFIFKNYTKVSWLFFGTSITIILLALRIKLTHNFFLLFMGWNLILAFIPLGIALFLYKYPYLFAKRWCRFLFTLVWLLFLPNAPYVITDFIHLRYSGGLLLVLDTLLLGLFATIALLTGLYSLQLLYSFYLLRYKRRIVNAFLFIVCLLSGYGVYLGRVVRLNSWDVVARPRNTVLELIQNMDHPMALLYSVAFGGLLLLSHGYLLKKYPLRL